jgi:hypothetical protein
VTEQLARRLSVSEAVTVFEQAETDVRAAFILLAGVESRLNATFSPHGDDNRWIHIRDRYSHRSMNFAEVEGSLTELRRDVWQGLVNRLELRSMMSIAAWEKLEKQIREGDPPPIDSESVAQMAEGFRQQMPDMLKEAVEEVFNWLRPRRDRYKTNSEFEIPETVCLSWCVEQAFDGGVRPCHTKEQHFTALENVLHALDGRGQTTKEHYSKLSQAIRTAKPAAVGWVGQTEFFKFKAFKNRSLHLKFVRLDLLARLNQLAGGMRLRGEEGAA